MGSTRTAWHVLLKILLSERGPRSFEVRDEVPLSAEPERWFAGHVGAGETQMALRKMEGFDEVLRKLAASVPLKQMLAAYEPEALVEVLGELPPERLTQMLPRELLAELSDAYLDSLPEPTRSEVRARVAEARTTTSPRKNRKPSNPRRRAA